MREHPCLVIVAEIQVLSTPRCILDLIRTTYRGSAPNLILRTWIPTSAIYAPHQDEL